MYTVEVISKDEYWWFLRKHPEASYQQTPEWGDARRAQWEPELIGWFDQQSRVHAVAVLRYRRVPGTSRSFAFIPQGPLLDWNDPHVAEQLAALGHYLRSRGVFGVRITPVVSLRKWDAATVKAGLADPEVSRISDMTPTEISPIGTRLVSTLRAAGWREAPEDAQSDASHPRFNFWLHLQGRSEGAVLAGMTKAWRKGIRRADRLGVKLLPGSGQDLDDVYRLYTETAHRNAFAAQPYSYFEAMWETLGNGFPGRFNMHIAQHEGSAVAVLATAQVGGRAEGVLSAMSMERPDLRPSNAAYWSIIQQAIGDKADLLDLGGVDDTVDDQDPAAGLVRFKAGMGADAYEYIGAWDLPLQPWLYAAFTRVLPLYAALGTQVRRINTRTTVLRPGRAKTS